LSFPSGTPLPRVADLPQGTVLAGSLLADD
jgi:hypothetical protein